MKRHHLCALVAVVAFGLSLPSLAVGNAGGNSGGGNAGNTGGSGHANANAGGKNLGQFVAAVHVSKNLGIAFSDLKAKMMDGASLGAAIKALRLEVKATTEANRALRQANRDLAGPR